MSTTKKHDSGAAEGARRATESPESSVGGAGRWSSRRKVSVILELLRGADLESTSRKYRVTVATLTDWRDRFLASGEAGLMSRETDCGRRREAPVEVCGRQHQHRERTAARKDRPSGEQSPFGAE